MEQYLDLKGLSCPLPVLKANKAIRGLNGGDVLICDVTDPAAPADFENFCESSGHEHVICEPKSSYWAITIKKSA